MKNQELFTPKQRFQLDSTSPAEVSLMVKFLGHLGVPIASATTKSLYDADFPVLAWDGEKVNQIVNFTNTQPKYNWSEFIAQFTEQKKDSITINIGRRYKAEVFPDRVIFTCNKVSKETITQVLEAMNELEPACGN